MCLQFPQNGLGKHPYPLGLSFPIFAMWGLSLTDSQALESGDWLQELAEVLQHWKPPELHVR